MSFAMTRLQTPCKMMRRFVTSGPLPSSMSSPSPVLPLDPNVKLLDFRVPYPAAIQDAFSLATANQEEITKHRIMLKIQQYKKHESDTGSATVQLAVMTEKIYNLARHFAMHKKDKSSQRGFQILLARRRKMMKYLRDKNFEEYRFAVKELHLEKEAIHLQ